MHRVSCQGLTASSRGKRLKVNGIKYRMSHRIESLGIQGNTLYVNGKEWNPEVKEIPKMKKLHTSNVAINVRGKNSGLIASYLIS